LRNDPCPSAPFCWPVPVTCLSGSIRIWLAPVKRGHAPRHFFCKFSCLFFCPQSSPSSGFFPESFPLSIVVLFPPRPVLTQLLALSSPGVSGPSFFFFLYPSHWRPPYVVFTQHPPPQATPGSLPRTEGPSQMSFKVGVRVAPPLSFVPRSPPLQLVDFLFN